MALRPGVPALSHFPSAAWRRALDRAIRGAGSAALGYGDPLGEPPLRAAIARHLSVARGVRCEPHQVVIAEGAQEAISLCVRLLSNPGDIGWVEDPGYRGVKAAMHAGDMRIVPVRVDAEGLCVSERDWQKHSPRLIYTTPSHQYPAGSVLSIARRLDLIAQARLHGAWIIEDDYDSEFRHTGEPIGAMQGLVDDAPVLYVGTFSKTMFPSLRLGFLVLPAPVDVRRAGAAGRNVARRAPPRAAGHGRLHRERPVQPAPGPHAPAVPRPAAGAAARAEQTFQSAARDRRWLLRPTSDGAATRAL